MREPRTLALMVMVMVAGCRPQAVADTAAEPVALLTAAGWEVMSAAADPFPQERPASFECPDWCYGEEGGGFEVNTDICVYGAFEQPIAAPVQAGDRLVVNLWHESLWAPEPAEAHVAIGVGDQRLWEASIVIPSEANVILAETEAEVSLPAGSAAWVHIHNHGGNSYQFLSLSVEPD